MNSDSAGSESKETPGHGFYEVGKCHLAGPKTYPDLNSVVTDEISRIRVLAR